MPAAAGTLPETDRLEQRELYGQPIRKIAYPFWAIHDRLKWGALGKYVALARTIPSWTRGEEAVALAQNSHSLNGTPAIVEIGSFLGCSTVLLAGARKHRGTGKVHCVDPFDLTGEEFSAAIYRSIGRSLRSSPREQFDRNVGRAGLTNWVKVHQGLATDVATSWTTPIDMLFLDGDYSLAGARLTFQAWSPHLKPGGLLAVHSSSSDDASPGHDGHYRVVAESVRAPLYSDIRRIGTTTFARKASTDPSA